MSDAPRRPRAARRVAEAASPLVLDSSCWIEYFADTDRAELFAAAIESVASLVVPVVTVYEVFRKLNRDAGEDVATEAIALMQRGQVVAVDTSLALAAAMSGLPLADGLIYATAQRAGAVLWTQDAHFDGRRGVKMFPKAG